MNQIKRLRELHGLSMQQLADDAEISKSYLYTLEQDKADPSVTVANRLATALHVSISELFQTDTSGITDREWQLLKYLHQRDGAIVWDLLLPHQRTALHAWLTEDIQRILEPLPEATA